MEDASHSGLKQEIKQQAPFASLEEEAFLNLLRTSSQLEHGLAEAMKAHGLTLTQYNVLRILRGAGEDGLCRNEVQERMLTPVPDVTRLLDRLEEAGFVGRARDPDDRRFVIARITEVGLDLLGRLDEPVVDQLDQRLGHLSEAELRKLIDLLEEARQHA